MNDENKKDEMTGDAPVAPENTEAETPAQEETPEAGTDTSAA